MIFRREVIEMELTVHMDGAVNEDEAVNLRRWAGRWLVVVGITEKELGLLMCTDRVFGHWGWGYCLWR